ncbi:MAG: hypothetical protein LCH41_01125 [Armatimonadetes bacterium]|nr:hypothetical protein [Armatimonadota bacterium]
MPHWAVLAGEASAPSREETGLSESGGTRPVSRGTWLAAAVLVVLVLAVFFVSRDTGPESTVRRYHQALANADTTGTRALQTDDSQLAGPLLDSNVRRLIVESQEIQLGRVRREGRTAYVDVVYRIPQSGSMMAVRYVVEKPGLRWRIDAPETLSLLRRMLQFE